MKNTAENTPIRNQRRQNSVRLWRDTALGAHGADLVAIEAWGEGRGRERLHFHDEFFVAAVLCGTSKYRIGRHAGVASPGSVLIIPQGEMHSVGGVFPGKVWLCSGFYPDHETLAELNRELFVGKQSNGVEFNASPVHQDANFAHYLSAYHQMIENETDTLARQQVFASAMAALLSRFARPNSTLRRSGHEPHAIRRAKECANARFSESSLSITDLAAAAGLSSYHFMRCFKAAVGITAYQYVQQVRLLETRRLLAQDFPFSQIACMTGFSDQSHFNRDFKKAFGVTPGQYAKATRKRKVNFPLHS